MTLWPRYETEIARQPRSFLLKQLVGGTDQVAVGMLGAVLAELFGLGHQFVGVDHRRLVLFLVVAVEPSQDHTDVLLARREELPAGPCRQVDIFRPRGTAAEQRSGYDQTRQAPHRRSPSATGENVLRFWLSPGNRVSHVDNFHVSAIDMK